MAEAATAIGLIGSIIGVCDGICKAWNDRKKDFNLPEAFQIVNTKIPILQRILQNSEEALESSKADLTPKEMLSLEATVQRCLANATKVWTIYVQIMPVQGEAKLVACKRILKSLGKGKRVEELMVEIAEDVKLVAELRGALQSSQDHSAKIDAIIEELQQVDDSASDTESERPKSVSNSNYGNGIQHNNIGEFSGIVEQPE